MAESHDKRPVLPSLLDRLTDDEPDNEQEVPLVGRKLDQMLREAMRRDIEAFLNTRRRSAPIPGELPHVQGTILDYGIPDFVGRTLASDRRRKQFMRQLEDCLRQHEPRFKSLRLEMVGGVDHADRSFHFHIDAVVFAEPAPESLLFASRIDPLSRLFRIKV